MIALADKRSDGELVEAANRGESKAFEALYQRYREWVFGAARRFCGNQDDACRRPSGDFLLLLQQVPRVRVAGVAQDISLSGGQAYSPESLKKSQPMSGRNREMCKGFMTVAILVLALYQPMPAKTAGIHFLGMDLWVDSHNEALAAYQVEITYDRSAVKIVGLEGGQAGSFTNAPYYDQKGFESGRIIVAAFTTDKDAPKGQTRVATIHIAVEGNAKPKLTCKLMTAAKSGGQRISPGVELRNAA
jgi:hypothetical protein